MGRADPLPLTYAADVHDPTLTLSPQVAAAIEDFAASPVGQQLADPAECRGRCKRASQRFVAALRAHRADGRIIEWAWDGAWHNAVVIGDDLVVDWTAGQFDPDLIGAHLVSRTEIDLRLLTGHGAARRRRHRARRQVLGQTGRPVGDRP